MIHSQDPRVQSIIPFVNNCCNPFSWMPKELKDEFYKAWGAWEAVQQKIKENGSTPELFNLDADLITVVKTLGGMKSIAEKRSMASSDKWTLLKAQLGIS